MGAARTLKTSTISSSRKTRRSRAWTAPRSLTPSSSTNTPRQADAYRRARDLARSVLGAFWGKKSCNPDYGIGWHAFQAEDKDGQEEEIHARRSENRERK